jgi:hypothetical protein
MQSFCPCSRSLNWSGKGLRMSVLFIITENVWWTGNNFHHWAKGYVVFLPGLNFVKKLWLLLVFNWVLSLIIKKICYLYISYHSIHMLLDHFDRCVNEIILLTALYCTYLVHLQCAFCACHKVWCCWWHRLCSHILHRVSVLWFLSFRIIWKLADCGIK